MERYKIFFFENFNSVKIDAIFLGYFYVAGINIPNTESQKYQILQLFSGLFVTCTGLRRPQLVRQTQEHGKHGEIGEGWQERSLQEMVVLAECGSFV